VTGEEFLDEFGWKQVSGDVFRKPRNPMLLSCFLGTGVQVFIYLSHQIINLNKIAILYGHLHFDVFLFWLLQARIQRLAYLCYVTALCIFRITKWICFFQIHKDVPSKSLINIYLN